jgi:D-arabinose 1-dehydrogenase-like Zn-dependent alcohol dehydrogenase
MWKQNLGSINRHAIGGEKNCNKLATFYAKQNLKSHVETLAFNTAVNDLKEMKFTKAKERVHIPHPLEFVQTGMLATGI